jgi:hypothetical protein
VEPNKPAPYFKDVFAKGIHHINFIDNSQVEKLPKVEYEIELGGYQRQDDAADEEEDEEENCLMTGPSDLIFNQETRPLKNLDLGFERLIARRLATYHCHYREKTQYDSHLLQKQMDLTTINVTLEEGDAAM